jgi:hypothetical protein
VTKNLALQYGQDILDALGNRRSIRFVIPNTPNNQLRRNAAEYACRAMLSKVRISSQRPPVFVVSSQGVPEYRLVTENTAVMLDRMIHSQPQQEDVGLALPEPDSNDRLQKQYEEWDEIGFDNGRDGNPVTVGFFPYVNLGKQDLSRLGIWKEVLPEYFRTNCLYDALSRTLNERERNFLRSVSQTQDVPTTKFDYIARLFKIKMVIHLIREDFSEALMVIDAGKRKVELAVWRRHIMRWEEDLPALLSSAKLRPMTDDEYNVAARARFCGEITGAYPDCAIRPWQDVRGGQVPPEKWFPQLKMSDADLTQLAERLSQENFPDPRLFRSGAEYGQHVLGDIGFELRGPLRDFICKAMHPPLLGSCFEPPFRYEGEMVELDQNGSYPSAYVNFPGVPLGKPRVIDPFKLTPEVWMDKWYFVKVCVQSYRCRHQSDPFPMVHLGEDYWDRTWLETVAAHYDINYTVLDGYYFPEISRERIETLTLKLWEVRKDLPANSPARAAAKLILNSLWGKSVWKWKPWTEKMIKPQDLPAELEKNKLLWSHMRKGDQVRIRTMKPFLAPWGRPQFAASVLSYSRKVVQEIIWKLADQSVPVIFVNTDSVLLPATAESGVKIGEKLGEWKVELEPDHFVCLGKKKRAYFRGAKILKKVFGKASETWWREEVGKREGKLVN